MTRSLHLRLFATVLFLGGMACAQNPNQLLKRAEKAIGGSKAFAAVRSTARAGRVTRLLDGATGKFEMLTARPNLFRLSFDIEGFETELGFNGRSGWARDSKNGLRTLTGQESLDFQAEAAYRNSLWLEAKKEKAKVTAGTGRNSVILRTSKGSSIEVEVEPTTGMVVKEVFPAGVDKRTFEYGNYRMSNGLRFPASAVAEIGGVKYRIDFEDLKINVALERTSFDFPRLSSEPLPDIKALLTELQENEERVEQILDTYSFTRKVTRREVAKDGTFNETGSETFRLSFYKGYRITRLIEKNGKPLGPSEQKDADRDAQKRVEEIEKLLAKQEKSRDAADVPSGEGRRISIAEVLRASNLLNPRRERFRGREVIVFDFEPNPNFDFKNAKSLLKFFGKTAGVFWIDEKDKQVARLEAYLADSFNVGGGVVAKLKKGASFVLEQERVNDEIWLPSSEEINLSVRVLLVKGIEVNARIRSFDYRKFTTEVKDATVNEIKSP